MKVWSVRTDGKSMYFGEKKRRMLTSNGCNEPYRNVYWCPKRKWFQHEPCPFVNKMECDTYLKMCGSL